MAPLAAAPTIRGPVAQPKQMVLMKVSLPTYIQQATSSCLGTTRTLAQRAASPYVSDSDNHNPDYFAPQDVTVKSSYNYVLWAVVGGIVGSIVLCTVIYLTRWCVIQHRLQQDIVQKALSRSSQTCRRWLANLPPPTYNQTEAYQMAHISRLSHATVEQPVARVQGSQLPSTASTRLIRLPPRARTAQVRSLHNESEEKERFTTLLRLEGNPLAGNHVNYIPEDDFRCFVDDLQKKALTNSLRHQQFALPTLPDMYLMPSPLSSPQNIER